MSHQDNPCVNCGACCVSLRVSFHRDQLVSEGGYVPDGLADDETAATCRMRGTDRSPPRCVALVGRVGERVHCGIYEYRPDPCREFAAHGMHGITNVACNHVRRRCGLSELPDPVLRL